MKENKKSWVELVRQGRLDEAYRTYLIYSPSFAFFRYFPFRRISSSLSVWMVLILNWSRPQLRFEDEALDLSREFLIFWKSPNVIGRMLLFKMAGTYFKTKQLDGRALAWYAHWLVFQGKYKQALLIFRTLLLSVPKGSRIHGEILSLAGNYFHSRGKLETALSYHKLSHEILKDNNDKFFMMFNIGTSAKTYAEVGDLERFNHNILASYDHLDPTEPDERYGMRVLIYASYLNLLNGNTDIGKQFFMSAEKSYQKSGSSLDKAIYCTFKSIILLFFRDLHSARKAIQEARLNLKSYGFYKGYSDLISVVEGHLKTGQISHGLLRKLLLQDAATIRSELETWYCQFFSLVLPVLENFEEQDLEKIVMALKKATSSIVTAEYRKYQVDSEDVKQARFAVSESTNGMMFSVDLFHKDKSLEVTLDTSFKKWRNPEIYEAIRSTLYLLQNISKEAQLKKITFSQAQKIKESEVARRIAHDIKSPLAALQIAVNGLGPETPDYHVIRSCTQRMEDIANSLTRKWDFEASNRKEKILVRAFVDTLIAIKRSEYKNSNVEIEVEFLNRSAAQYVFINESELSRTLSNIINNSVESYPAGGKVHVIVDSTTSQLAIKIKDFGRGIHTKDFDRIFEKDVSLRKEGTGLGLYYSKLFIETNGGKIEVDSMFGMGTTMTITYPLSSPPSWIKTTLFLDHYRQIIIADDYEPNAELMKRKIEKECPDKEIICFSRISDLVDFVKLNGEDRTTFYIVDHDFIDESITGLNFISEYKLQDRAVLATHHHENEEVVRECKAGRVKIIPKIIFQDIRAVNERANVFIVDDEKYFLKAIKSKLDNRFNVHIFENCHGIIEKSDLAQGPSFFFVDKNFGEGSTDGGDLLSALKDQARVDLFNISEDSNFFHSDAIKLRKKEIANFLI